MIYISPANPVRFSNLEPFPFGEYAPDCKYLQKWQHGDCINLQFLSDSDDFSLTIEDENGIYVDNIEISKMTTSLEDVWFEVYECSFKLENLPFFGNFRLKLQDDKGNFAFSKCFSYQEQQENTVLLKYRNSSNFIDIIFDTAIDLYFRVEGTIYNYSPKNEPNVFLSSKKNPYLVSSTPYRTFNLQIGYNTGVAEWSVDIVNYALSCDEKKVNGMSFNQNEGSELEIIRFENVSVIGAEVEILFVGDDKYSTLDSIFVLGADDIAIKANNNLIGIK